MFIGINIKKTSKSNNSSGVNLLIHLVFVLISCASKEVQEKKSIADPVHLIKVSDSFTLSKTLDNVNELGFKEQELGPASGVSGMFIDGTHLYISDSYYGNIKRFDLNSKKIELVSDVLSERYKDVGELFLSGDTLICLSTFQDKIYYLSKDLKLLSERSMLKGQKEFLMKGDQVYISFLMDRSKLFDSKLNYIKADPKAVPAMEFETTTVDSKLLLKNRFGSYQIKSPIPSSKYLEGSNVAFDKQTIVFFDDSNEGYSFVVLHY